MRPDPGSPRGSSRLNLIKAAVRVFAEKGFEGARVREIAGLAGVNSSLVSFHYRGREGGAVPDPAPPCRAPWPGT